MKKKRESASWRLWGRPALSVAEGSVLLPIIRFRVLLVLLMAVVAGPPARCDGVIPDIRVGLVPHRESVVFTGPSGVIIQELRNDTTIASVPAGELWEARAIEGGIQVFNAAGAEIARSDSGIRLFAAREGLATDVVTICGVLGHWDKITDRDYRGIIEILPEANELLTVKNLVDIETYLRGVVPSEMPASYPMAALQAQAVAARNEALAKAGRHNREGFDLCSGQHCQVYGGATSERPESDAAVAATHGEVLTYQGRLADTLYASTCGGHTANNEDYWPEQHPAPYLRGQPDFEEEDQVSYQFPLSEKDAQQYLKYAPRVNCNQPRFAKTDKIRWWQVTPREQMEETLRQNGQEMGVLLGLRIRDRSESGVVRELNIIGSKKFVRLRGGAAIRQALGGLNSASFAIKPVKEKDGIPVAFIIWGAGWGHQVGMCQVGAAGLAEKGWDYRRILEKYYTGCKIEKRY